MNVKRKDKVYIGVSTVVVLAMAGAIGFIVAAKDGFEASIIVVNWLQDKIGIPKTTVITVLMGVLVVGVLAILILLGKSIWKKDNRSFTEAEEHRARDLYLEWIKKDIDNRLKSSINHATYIDLKLKDSEKLISARNYTHHNNSDGTDSMIWSIDPLLNTKSFALLLLGAPGAGKTTTMLNCASQAITKAEADKNNNIPVFINLAKWGRKERLIRLLPTANGSKRVHEEDIAESGLDEWMIRIVSRIRRTGLTKDIVKYWLEEKQQITLFLDGLDEADEAVRKTIIDKINIFVNKYAAVSVLVTSRLADYEALVKTSKIMLNLDGAVTIHPLTPEQIKNYLIAAEAPQLQNLLDNDEALKEMARSPLELSIMVLARDNTEFKALLSPKISSITTKRKALFDVYVKTMVQREQLKRKKCPDLHDSDYAKISVSDDHLLRLNKNLGLIARMLCVNSRIAYRPGRLYDYLTTNEATFLNDDVLDEKLSRKPINIVNKAILLLGLGILTLCYCNRYPILLFMFLIPLFLNNYLLGISDMKFKNEKIKSLVPVLWGWLVAMVFFPFCYWPIDYLIFRWPPLIWVFTILSGCIYLLSSYNAGGLVQFLRVPFWKHAANIAVVSFPLLVLWMFNETNYRQFVFIGVVCFMIIAYRVITESTHSWTVLGGILFVVISAVPGLLLFKNQMGLCLLLMLQIVMILVMRGRTIYDNKNYASYHVATILFPGIFLGALTGLFVPPAYSLLITICLLVGTWNLGRITYVERLYEQGFSWLGSKVLLVHYKLHGKIPFNYKGFLRYATRSLLLKKHKNEYEFMHRRIRDYFATLEYMSFLEKDLAGREYAIRKFCSLKDASCDVLLEMIDDHDKGIRIGSLIGLGDIGSAIAAKSLIVAIEKTSGELKEVAIRQIFKIKDIAAVPDLINILDDSPVDSLTFEAALTALTENLSSLHVWENEGKIKEYINIPSAKFKVKIQSILADKDGRRKAGVELIIKNCLTLRGSDLALKYNLTKKLCKLTVEELLICIGNENLIVVHIAFKLLCSNGQAKSAIEGILQSLQSGRVLGEKIKFSNADYKKMKPVFVNIIKSNDEDYLRIALSFLQKHPVPEMEETILQATKNYEGDLKLAGIKALKYTVTKRSIPFLVSAIRDDRYRSAAMEVLYKIDIADLKALIQDVNNVNIHHLLIHVLFRKPTFRNVSSLKKLLAESSVEFQSAVIYKLGQWKIERAIPILWDLFSKKNEKTLQALIYSLSNLNEKRIIPQLPELFWQYNWLQPAIFAALIELKADREIIELYEAFKKQEEWHCKSNEPLLLLLSEHFVKTDKKEIAIEIIFPLHPLSLFSKLSPTVNSFHTGLELDAMYNDISIIVKNTLRNENKVDHIEKKERNPLVWDFDSVKHLPRKSVLKMLFKHDREMALLDTIYSYNPGLSREIAKDFVQNSYQGIETVLFKKLLHVTEAFQKMLLLIVIDCFKPEGDYVLQHLRSYLAEQHDDNITFLTIRTLGHLKDEHSLNKFLYYLESPNEKIVEAALISINDLARNKSIKTDNFLDIVIQNNLVQRLLTDSRYIFVLNQLGIPDLQKLAGHENPDFRYLAAIYSGILGHGELMDLLNSLLGDPAAINIANDHGHTTVSSGALHSLNRIGSPSAKSCVDSWQQNKIL